MWKLVFVLTISWCSLAYNNTDQDRADILEQHTSARGNVTPSASNIRLLYVWANTTEVGCGMSRCHNGNTTSVNQRYLVACAYYPVGNIESQRPYQNGSSCTKCPDDFFCYRNQCTNDTSLFTTTYTTDFDTTWDFS
uniref:SCP domain-containing protein n=1 Tax=Mesocestoides corti TaxID=53468 RepID=A0A5K3FTT8_MESCO